MRRRFRFWKSAFMRGLPSLWQLFGALTVIVGGSILSAVTDLSDEPIQVGLGIAGAMLLGVLSEGAFALWRESDEARVAAENALGSANTREAVAGRLDGLRREFAILAEDVPDNPDAPDGKRHLDIMHTLKLSYNDVVIRVHRELRLHASGYYGFFEADVPGLPVGLVDFRQVDHVREALACCQERLVAISDALRAGKDHL